MALQGTCEIFITTQIYRQGPGAVASDNGKLTFNTLNMRMNETYEFMLVVKKDNRTANVSLQLDILPGDPPAISIGLVSLAMHYSPYQTLPNNNF